MKGLLGRALECLKFADDEMGVEPYEHGDGDMVEMHYEMRNVIRDIEEYMSKSIEIKSLDEGLDVVIGILESLKGGQVSK